ncbi:MAG: hypothetical protein EHM32_07890 [Spirochaetales bacterium]|nr:MAG: hypothetical protein EHM32_07890 [Spirochaetales bacterium]
MIKLKNGFELPYNRDIDAFLNSLAQSIIRESIHSSLIPRDTSEDIRNEAVLREIMDNCIYVTHQVFELFKKDENAGKLLATGFLFNFVILLFQTMEGSGASSPGAPASESGDPETTH